MCKMKMGYPKMKMTPLKMKMRGVFAVVHRPRQKLSAQYPKGFEGDRAERSEVKTSQCDVFRESVADSYSSVHAAVSE